MRFDTIKAGRVPINSRRFDRLGGQSTLLFPRFTAFHRFSPPLLPRTVLKYALLVGGYGYVYPAYDEDTGWRDARGPVKSLSVS